MQDQPHISSVFDEDLRNISTRIAEMGGLAEEQLASALEAVTSRDDALAEQVIKADRKLDEMEMALEQATIQVIALRAPVASDLRAVIAALKIASALERIGDLAKNIAKRTLVLNQTHPLKVMSSIGRMGKQTQTLTTEALDAWTAGDKALAVSVWRRDIEIDEMHNSIVRELMTYMMEDPRNIGLCSQLLFVVKNIERIGDHTTFIAEMTYYVATGEALTDDRPKIDNVGEMTEAADAENETNRQA